MSGEIRVEKDGALGWVVMDHQERRNALTAAMWQAIPAALEELVGDDAISEVLGGGDDLDVPSFLR